MQPNLNRHRAVNCIHRRTGAAIFSASVPRRQDKDLIVIESAEAAFSPFLRSQPNSSANAVSATGRTKPRVSSITAEAFKRPRGLAGQYHNFRPIPSAARASSILSINSRSVAGAILRYRRCGSAILCSVWSDLYYQLVLNYVHGYMSSALDNLIIRLWNSSMNDPD